MQKRWIPGFMSQVLMAMTVLLCSCSATTGQQTSGQQIIDQQTTMDKQMTIKQETVESEISELKESQPLTFSVISK